MAWAALCFVALWLAYFAVWLHEHHRLRPAFAEVLAAWRKFPRGQVVILSLLFLWAVRVGGTKEGGQQGGQTSIAPVAVEVI